MKCRQAVGPQEECGMCKTTLQHCFLLKSFQYLHVKNVAASPPKVSDGKVDTA